MKLLLDENLSNRIVEKVEDLFPGSKHVKDLGLIRVDDGKIWAAAKQGGFCILSKDADFRQLSFLLGQPPKFIFLRLGNSSTARIVQVLRAKADVIQSFGGNPRSSLLVLS